MSNLFPDAKGVPYKLVRTAEDLPDANASGEHVLPEDVTVLVYGNVDLGSNAIRLSEGTILRGLADATITSTADGVVRASGLADHVIIREVNITSVGGRCIDLAGPITQQCNLFFLGLIAVGAGASCGTIDGFQVQALKDCFMSGPDGITFSGTTRKTFVSQCPFYDVTGSAITFAADFDAAVVDITSTFFKFDSPGVGITAESGYSVGDGILRGSLIDGTAVPLDGLAPGDVEWQMTDNLGVRDSRIAAVAYLDAAATTTINTVSTYEDVAGAFTIGSVADRFSLNVDDMLVYEGRLPALVTAMASFTVEPDNNVRTGVRFAKNGTGIAETEVIVEQGAGTGSLPRPGTAIALVEVETGDTLSLQIANLDDATDIEWLSATIVVRG